MMHLFRIPPLGFDGGFSGYHGAWWLHVGPFLVIWPRTAPDGGKGGEG